MGTTSVWAATRHNDNLIETEFMQVAVGKGEIITIPGGVSDVMIADPKVLDISAIQSDKLYVVGTSIGTTNIMVFDGTGELLKRINFDVNLNVAEIQRQVHHIFPMEKDVDV